MWRRRLAILLLPVFCLVCLGFGQAGVVVDSQYATVQLLDNGGFEETDYGAIGAHWLASLGRGRVGLPSDFVSTDASQSGDRSLAISSDELVVYQYVPCPEETVDLLTLRAGILLEDEATATVGTLTVRDSARRELTYVIGTRP